MGSKTTMLTTLIQDAILKLCTQNVTFEASLEIDGIICITPGDQHKEIVVKMHRTIMKPASQVETFPAVSSDGLQVAPPQRNRKQHSASIDPGNFGSEVTANISFDEMPKQDPYVSPEDTGGTGYYGDEGPVTQQQYDTTPSKSPRKRRAPPARDTSSEQKYIKVEPGESEILMEDPASSSTLMEDPASSSTQDSNDGYTDTPQGWGYGSNPSEIFYDAPTVKSSSDITFTEAPAQTQCSKCNQVFPSKRCLEYHTQMVHLRFCDVCTYRIDHLSEAEVINHGLWHKLNDPDSSKVWCEVCYKSFHTKTGLKHHLASLLMCNVCGKQIPKAHKSAHTALHRQ